MDSTQALGWGLLLCGVGLVCVCSLAAASGTAAYALWPFGTIAEKLNLNGCTSNRETGCMSAGLLMSVSCCLCLSCLGAALIFGGGPGSGQ